MKAQKRREHRLLAAFHSYMAGDAHKYDFYQAAIDAGFSAPLVSELTGIRVEVADDRMRYLRKLARETS